MKDWNIKRVITNVNTKYGAPIGRNNIGFEPIIITSGKSCKIYKSNKIKIYNKRVILSDGYDNGGAYWGIGNQLRVRFTADLTFIEFYRL